jgi:hypothetical protein
MHCEKLNAAACGAAVMYAACRNLDRVSGFVVLVRLAIDLKGFFPLQDVGGLNTGMGVTATAGVRC